MAKTLPKHRPKLTIRKPTTCGHTSKNITQNRPFGSPLRVAKMLPKHRPKPAYSEAHYVWPVFQKHRPKPAYSEAHYAWPVFQKHHPKPAYSEAHYAWPVFQKHHPKPAYSEAHYAWPVFQKHRPKPTVRKPTMCGQNASKTSPKTANLEAHYVWPKRFQNVAQNRQFGSPLCVAKTLSKRHPKRPIRKLTTCGQAFKKPPPQNANLKAHYYYIVREEICAIKHH